jgi:predicted enzyme related to lactoylglutathione lyase
MKKANQVPMKKIILISLTLITTFCLGFAFKTILPTNSNTMKKVTGIGGVFFKSNDPEKLMEWYQKHLGLEINPYGATFEWYEGFDNTKKARTQWTPFPNPTKYFAPSTKDFMINYRVDNLEALYVELKKEDVTIVDEIETYDYGKFLHILDAEGNKIELWEPID